MILRKADSIKQIFDYLEINDVGGNRLTLYKIIKEYKIDDELEKLRERSKITRKNKLKKESLLKEIPFEMAFCEHSQLGRKNVKKNIKISFNRI